MAMRGCAFVIGHRLPVQELLELGAPEDLGHFGVVGQRGVPRGMVRGHVLHGPLQPLPGEPLPRPNPQEAKDPHPLGRVVPPVVQPLVRDRDVGHPQLLEELVHPLLQPVPRSELVEQVVGGQDEPGPCLDLALKAVLVPLEAVRRGPDVARRVLLLGDDHIEQVPAAPDDGDPGPVQGRHSPEGRPRRVGEDGVEGLPLEPHDSCPGMPELLAAEVAHHPPVVVGAGISGEEPGRFGGARTGVLLAGGLEAGQVANDLPRRSRTGPAQREQHVGDRPIRIEAGGAEALLAGAGGVEPRGCGFGGGSGGGSGLGRRAKEKRCAEPALPPREVEGGQAEGGQGEGGAEASPPLDHAVFMCVCVCVLLCARITLEYV